MKNTLLLLANGFETYEASVFIDVLGWNLIDGDGTTKLQSCGLTKEVKSSFGQCMLADMHIDEVNVDDFDAIAIPGGFEEYDFYEEAFDQRFSRLIREFHEKDKWIASICVASIAIAKSGILEGIPATTYEQKTVRKDALCSFGAQFVSEPIVQSGRIITSWNPSTAIDVALLLLEKLSNKANADYIRGLMGFGERITFSE